MQRFWSRQEWLSWWDGLSLLQRIWPLATAAAYWAVLPWVGSLRPGSFFFGFVPMALYYVGPRAQPFLYFVFPLCLFGTVYDGQRYFANSTRGSVHFFTGLADLLFLPVYVGSALYMRFWLPRQGTAIAHPRSIGYRSPQIMWALFWVNLIGYSANVPGAIPSLSIACPLVIVYYSFRFGALRVLSTTFFLLTCFAAVYLNHQYGRDIFLGSVYALATAFSLDAYWNWDLKRRGVVVPGPDPEPAFV